MKGRRPKPDPTATVYVLKVALADDRRIWRRIAIRSDQSLDDLHAAIFDAFDRLDEHLYSFYLLPPGAWRPGARSYEALTAGVEYTSPENLEEGAWLGWQKTIYNAGRTRIGSLGLTAGRRLRYLFDFGDSWWHEITVEQTDGKPGQEAYPQVIERRGDSPPQYSYDEDGEDREEDED